jgi:hypothetical protein
MIQQPFTKNKSTAVPFNLGKGSYVLLSSIDAKNYRAQNLLKSTGGLLYKCYKTT